MGWDGMGRFTMASYFCNLPFFLEILLIISTFFIKLVVVLLS